MNTPPPDDPAAHCVARLRELVARDEPDRRALLQIGYNLGRLAELAGLGRGPTWDRWKGPVAAWDRPALEALARELRESTRATQSPQPDAPSRSRRPEDVSPDSGADD